MTEISSEDLEMKIENEESESKFNSQMGTTFSGILEKDPLALENHENPLKCSLCEKVYATSKSLRDHMRMHTGEMPYSCSFCDRKFRYSSNCRTHEKRHADKPKLNPNFYKNFYTESIKSSEERELSPKITEQIGH